MLPRSDTPHTLSTLDAPADYDRRAYFQACRDVLELNVIRQPFVDGCNAILDAWTASPWRARRQFAYILATAYHETGAKMSPVREIGRGAGHAYGEPDPTTGETYYGRGFVQMTWRGNYSNAATLLRRHDLHDLDLVRSPDDALRPNVAADILVYGMMEGWFTGEALPQFVTREHADYAAARLVVNAMDRADLIASYAGHFDEILRRSAIVDVFRPDPGDSRSQRTPQPCHEVQALVRKIKRITGATRISIHFGHRANKENDDDEISA